MIALAESEKYYFDAKAAERPIKFIERYLCHYEDRYAGQPFLLLDWQKQVTRDIFGWKRRDNGLRRFREVYLEIAKGNGKSPFITALALYVFFAEDQEGQHLLSIATDFKQANITFDMAKKMIQASPQLLKKVEIKQYEIRFPSRNSKWEIVSGTAEGKHGFRPNLVLADEAHEWDNRKLYDNVTSNLLKRSEPLMIVATNAGSDRQSICYELHTRAERVLKGESKDDTLYPVIYAADAKDDWGLETTWVKANPSLGHTITADALRLEYIKARENPALEARFRRLYLSQWVQGSSRWLDMDLWDAATEPHHASLRELPCYLALDLSLKDDLSSIAAVWVGPKDLYVKVWTYVPRMSARKYEDQDSIPFTAWANEKYVRLLKSDTVDDGAQRRIGRFIKQLAKNYQVKALAYDRWKANALITRLERDGIICLRVAQNFEGIGPAAVELERRLKAGTIYLPKNPCLRWQASNVEVIADKYGNIRPVKEAQKGEYAGRRGSKIDGIVSIIIAISEVLKHDMRKVTAAEALRQWDGAIKFI